MALLSPVYVALIAVAALLFQVCPDRYRNAYLTAVSLSFYSLFSTISAGVMVCFTLLTFVAARKIDEYREHVVARFVLWAAIAVQLAYLVFLKAIPVLGRTRQAGAAARFLAGFGVSYYTFKLIGYLIDVYWPGRRQSMTLPVCSRLRPFFRSSLPARSNVPASSLCRRPVPKCPD